MKGGVRLKQLVSVLLPALALMCAIPVAAMGAQGRDHGGFGGFWHHGFWGDNAALAGTVSGNVTPNSFGANVYQVAPGPGNAGTTPATTPATITIGSSTKVITAGSTAITAGDDFYAVYAGVPADTPLATLETESPSVIYAYPAPTPEVEVRGVVTTAPTSGSDSFTATAYVVAPHHFSPVHWPSGDDNSGGNGGGWGGGTVSWGGGGNSWTGSSSSGGDFRPISTAQTRATAARGSHCLPIASPVSAGTPGTVITTDSSTQITIDGQSSSVGALADGDVFTAVYAGTPDEPLATITSTPALSVSAWAPANGNTLYAFVGTVASTDTTAGTVTVNVTSSIPNGLFSGADTFSVGSQTIVLGTSSNTLFGSLANVATGDVVAGGVIGPSGATASTIESTPLQVLVDFPQSSSSTTTSQASIRRAEHRAVKLLRSERTKLRHHHHYRHHRRR